MANSLRITFEFGDCDAVWRRSCGPLCTFAHRTGGGGHPTGPNDTFIAAHALALGATLVTADAEFTRVPGLQVENWLQPL